MSPIRNGPSASILPIVIGNCVARVQESTLIIAPITLYRKRNPGFNADMCRRYDTGSLASDMKLLQRLLDGLLLLDDIQDLL